MRLCDFFFFSHPSIIPVHGMFLLIAWLVDCGRTGVPACLPACLPYAHVCIDVTLCSTSGGVNEGTPSGTRPTTYAEQRGVVESPLSARYSVQSKVCCPFIAVGNMRWSSIYSSAHTAAAISVHLLTLSRLSWQVQYSYSSATKEVTSMPRFCRYPCCLLLLTAAVPIIHAVQRERVPNTLSLPTAATRTAYTYTRQR